MTVKPTKQTKIKTTKKPKKGSLEAISAAFDKLNKKGINLFTK
jgi:hypothetical protein